MQMRPYILFSELLMDLLMMYNLFQMMEVQVLSTQKIVLLLNQAYQEYVLQKEIA